MKTDIDTLIEKADGMKYCDFCRLLYGYKSLFSFKEIELTGNEKREKAEKANERKMIAINSVNKLANSLIQDVINNAVNSEENW